VDLAGDGNADVVGAKVTLEANGRTQTRFAKGGGSYASTPDRRLVFGLGDKGKVTKLTVTWPGGKKQEWTDVPTGKYHVLVQGKAELQSERPKK
jgi:lipoprotein-anchoring transpeptidase ErfK/SrfK